MYRALHLATIFLLAFALIICSVNISEAKSKGTRKSKEPKSQPKEKPAAPAKTAPNDKAAKAPKPEAQPVSLYCVEAETGMVLAEENADIQRAPASMVKLMVMLLVLEGKEAGKWNLDQTITVSQRAQGMGGSQVNLAMNEQWPLNTLMLCIAVASANDAAVAVAEGLWGSTDKCLEAMNERAKALGMVNTTYRSVHGLPPSRGEVPDQTTARDMGLLGRECVKHPAIFDWTSVKEYQLRPNEYAHPSTNKLMKAMPDCDGLKTGFIRLAGFCITASAKRNDVRLIAVVMGDDSKYERFHLAQQLLDEGFKKVTRVKAVSKGDVVGDPILVDNCMTNQVKLVAADDLYVIVKTEDAAKVQVVSDRPEKLVPPLAPNAVVGEFRVQIENNVLGKGSLLNPVDLKPKTFWQRVFG